MAMARNGIRHPTATKQMAIKLRREGKTHREIAHKLNISLGSAWLWLKGVRITHEQKQAIEKRRTVHHWNRAERNILRARLRPFQFRAKYTDTDLLNKIKKFYVRNGRIPLKREFNALKIYRDRFGSWNNAIKRAGFDTNPVLFAKKFIARDGHKCDSFTEKIIGNWLHSRGIAHRRAVRYGKSKLTADFAIGNEVLVEFFGLAGVQPNYDKIIDRKRKLSRELGLQLIEVYPDDIFPVIKLPQLLGSRVKS